jgi:hypothetical protein
MSSPDNALWILFLDHSGCFLLCTALLVRLKKQKAKVIISKKYKFNLFMVMNEQTNINRKAPQSATSQK